MKITTLTQKYGKYAATLIVGLIVGGFTMQMASASVPDASGTIHGCRNNLTTMLRVIDSASQSCGSDESGLNWDQNGVNGYARVVYNSGTDTYSLDSNRSTNITNVYTAGGSNFVCMTLGTTPKSVSVQSEGNSSFEYVGIKDANGWTGFFSQCDTYGSGANIGVMVESPSSFFINTF